ncbi:MAG TPA: GNAT family N-acetyltransferase [Actinomycetota bacterium]|jgi:GNAT superfamily N-acetyltransferase
MTPGEVREIAAGSTRLAFRAMSELRPHLRDVDEFVQRVDEVQRPQGYRLVGVFVDGLEDAVAVAGFRVLDNLVSGNHVYVDDLVTMTSQRGRGHARHLMQWLIAEARRLGCDQFQLDSAPHRHSAHRLYLTSGMDITSFHFGLKLSRTDVDNLGEL